ncbi:hypothetical protein [Candidatus Nitrosocosmicus sp. T]
MNYSKYGLKAIYNNEFMSFSNLKFRLVIYLLLNPPGPFDISCFFRASIIVYPTIMTPLTSAQDLTMLNSPLSFSI